MTILLGPGGARLAGVRRIAVLRSNAIGDFLVAVPALEALRAAYPQARITLLGAALHPGWLTGRPGPWDEVEAVPEDAEGEGKFGADTPELARFVARHQARGYDLAVQLHGGGGHSNPFVRRLGARVTVGSRAPGAPALDRWVPYQPYQPEVLRFLEVVGLAGAPVVALEPRLAVTAHDLAEAARVVPPGAAPLVAVHPGATDPRRRWPADRFAAVTDELAGRGAQVVLVGGPGDAALTRAVRAGMRLRAADRAADRVIDLAGRLSLRGLTGLLSRCALLVGNDSGPRHLAEATGTATAAVFWCGNLINVGPLTRSRHRAAVSFRTRCPVCDRDQFTGGRCGHDPSFVDAVSVDEVRTHALDLIDRFGVPGTGEVWPAAGGVTPLR